MIKRVSFEQLILAFIIIVGVGLRLYHLGDMSFMHDEFSALFRTRFDSFSEVINIGVKIGDTHPAGVQVFLWWYVHLVGENELLLKLPFLIMGVLSIPLTYNIGKEWFNKNVGLISAVFIATSQYSLTYSVIIRPYISGLFFSLAMVYFWTSIYKGKTSFKNYLGYVLFSVLCAYNHHFSLLFAFLVGVTGLFILDKKVLVKYIIAGITIFLVYLPNIPILLFQLNKGGLGSWLSKPSMLFPLSYIQYVFHFSVWNYLLVLFVVFISLIYNWNTKRSIYYKVSVVWFSFPLIIGLLYSLFVSPVIQYSMLIFTFPFFLFLIFGLFPKKISKKVFLVIVMALMFSNVYTLVVNREHYRILYETRHLQFLQDIDSLSQKKEATILIANHTEINKYYQAKYNWNFPYINYIKGVSEELGLNNVQKLVDDSEKPFFIYGGLSYALPEIVQIIKGKYPSCILKKDYYASNLYVFSKERIKDTLLAYFYEGNHFVKKKEGWKNVDLNYQNKGAELEPSKEWGPSYSIDLVDKLEHRNDVIDVCVKFKSKTTKSLDLVTIIKDKDSLIYYGVTPSSSFMKDEKESKFIYKTIELAGVSIPSRDILFSSYLWNREKGEFLLQNFEVRLRSGNPIQYSLYEPILNNYE